MNSQKFTLAVTILTYMVTISSLVKGQQVISTPCTASMISTFTPCMNYITGSSANGSSPSSNCCDAFKNVMSNSVDCACLLVTAGIPLSLGTNRTVSIGISRFCKGVGVPLQCQASGTPLPPPGPLQFGAPPPSSASPPSSAFSPQASKGTAATPVADQPSQFEIPPMTAPSMTPGVIPVLSPPMGRSMINMPPTLRIILIGFMMVVTNL